MKAAVFSLASRDETAACVEASFQTTATSQLPVPPPTLPPPYPHQCWGWSPLGCVPVHALDCTGHKLFGTLEVSSKYLGNFAHWSSLMCLCLPSASKPTSVDPWDYHPYPEAADTFLLRCWQAFWKSALKKFVCQMHKAVSLPHN